MKTYISGLIILVLAFFSSLNAQTKYRLYHPFKGGDAQIVQAQHSQYNLYHFKYPHFEMTYFYKEGNKLSMYQAPYTFRPYSDEMFANLSNEDLLNRIFCKYLHPYYKTLQGSTLQGIGCTMFPKLDGIIRELMFDTSPKEVQQIPIEVFERMEAEIMLSNIRVTFNQDRDLLNGADWISVKRNRFDEGLRDYSKEQEARHYGEEMPIVINKRRISPDREELIRKIFRYAYREMWDTAKFRYFTPEIMSRLIFDVERGAEYFDASKFNYFYKQGERSNLLLPMDKRSRFSTATDMRAYSTEYAVYQILYEDETYHDMSDAEFVVETLVRLMQTYISYELMIEAYLDPKVKAYLTDQDWFMGNFPKLLSYYAEFKGLDLRELSNNCVEELLDVFYGLGLAGTIEVNQVLGKHFSSFRF